MLNLPTGQKPEELKSRVERRL